MAFQHPPQYSQYNAWTPMQSYPVGAAPQQEQFMYKPPDLVHEQVDAISAEPEYKKRTFRQRWLGGLKITLRGFAFAAGVVLMINISWLLWAKKKYGITSGYGTIQRGDCTATRKLNTWLHLLINTLSTLLLMGSNAFMQAFSGPTRQEVDHAHRRGRWLHIGVLSFRNLRGIAKRKAFVCLVLALSSIPFHLLYNSLVYTSLAANNYYWAVVSEDFLAGAPWNITDPGDYYYIESTWGPLNKTYEKIQQSASSYQRLEPASCLEEYSSVFLSSHRNLVLVSSEKNKTNSILSWGGTYSGDIDEDIIFWLCPDPGDGPSARCEPSKYFTPSSWNVSGHPIEYCLSERTKETCAVQFSYDIMIVVIAFNAVKLAAMLYVLCRLDAEKLFATVGDAMGSFLTCEDPTTFGMCLANKRELERFWRTPGLATQYKQRPGRWGRAASKKRWCFFTFLMTMALSIVMLLLAWGLSVLKGKDVDTSISGLWNLGFGTLNAKAFVLADNTGNAAGMSVLANSPQVILSFIFLTYNGLMTSMFLAADFSSFALSFRGRNGASHIPHLMVSHPVGKQRGTWLLGLPGIYGVGFFTIHTLLHWFVSQSIFNVQISIFNEDGTLDLDDRISNCGYSPIAIIFTVIAGLILVLSAIGFGLRKFRKGSPPVVSTCSAAISAACHSGIRDEAMTYQELRWGATGPTWNGVGHCSIVPAKAFSAGLAGEPVNGWLYAGFNGTTDSSSEGT